VLDGRFVGTRCSKFRFQNRNLLPIELVVQKMNILSRRLQLLPKVNIILMRPPSLGTPANGHREDDQEPHYITDGEAEFHLDVKSSRA
jgi:hypothetical protein